MPTGLLDDLPDFCGHEDRIAQALRGRSAQDITRSGIDFPHIRSAAAIALHMHQPLIPAGGDDLRSAAIISNLQYMMEHPEIGDNHNASAFLWCYERMAEFVPELLAGGKQPRVMLDYSGTLLYGLQQMGLQHVLQSLRTLATDERYQGAVEWLGTAWGHAVAPSTPVQDFRLHVLAWQEHFAALFGDAALARVRGFSPPEMALPNHPDVAYAFVKTLLDCGYEWVLVQEHTVEQQGNGQSLQQKHLPQRLVCTNSQGQSVSITAIIKTQGSDTKLVGQMQPWYEAQGLSRMDLGGRQVPPLVTQIADGENGGVMMNEFPPKYQQVVEAASGSAIPLVNVSEYLAYLTSEGVTMEAFPAIQPVHQQRLWERFHPGDGPERLAAVIAELHREDQRISMDGGSWTNNISWVRGYGDLLGPMERLSSLFYEKVLRPGIPSSDPRYRQALFFLLISETSCFRYWGEGLWTDYGKELCRRGIEFLEKAF